MKKYFGPAFLFFLSLAPLHSQKIAFDSVQVPLSTGITVDLILGDFEVPENREKQTSKKIKLKVAKIKAKTNKNLAPIMYLAGGPGGSSINDLQVKSVQELLLKLNESHDIILVDQRGTGNSNPKLLWQPSPEFRDRNKGLIQDMLLDKNSMLELIKISSLEAQSHFKGQSIDIEAYNSLESAHDINAVCEALGIEKINLLGFSYGTHLGLATIKFYPKLVKSAVLVATEGLNNTYKLPFQYDEQLGKISVLAAQYSNSANQSGTMESTLAEVLNQLEENPIALEIENRWTKTTDKVRVGKFGLQLILRMDLGDDNDFIYFPKLLAQIKNNDHVLLKNFATKRYNQFQAGVHGMALMMNMSSGATNSRRRQILAQAKKSLFDNVMNFPEMDIESLWGNPNLGDTYRSKFNSSVPTLFVSGSLDANTPTHQTEKILKRFKNGRHLIVEYAGHESLLPNLEVQQQIIDFFSEKELNLIHKISNPRPKFKSID